MDPHSEAPELSHLAEASPLRRAFAWTIFPLVFFGALIVTRLGLDAGLEAWVATLPAIGPAAFMVIVSERVQPHSARWTRSHDDVPTDLTHMIFSQVLPPPLVELGLKVSTGSAAVWLAGYLGRGLWPVELNFWWQFLLAAVVGEFGQYWWHRSCHERALLWRLHATHHSAPRLWWLNAGRFHPVDTVFAYGLTILPLLLFGCPPDVLAMIATMGAVHGMFQHANIDLRLGPLNWVFSMAELHRWHHSRSIADANSNYGANLIFWDIVFGTRQLPAHRTHDPADVGFDGDHSFPQRYFAQLASPFVWNYHTPIVDEPAPDDSPDGSETSDCAQA